MAANGFPNALKEAFPEGKVAEDILKIIKDHGIENYTVQVKAGSAKGDNYIGLLYRVNILGTNKNMHLIVKSSKKGGLMAEFVPSHDVFKREIFMYENVFKKYTEFQESKGITETDKGFFNFPKVYCSNETEGNEYIIFEDLVQLDFTMHDRKQPLDIQHCELVLKRLAKYHACSFALKDQAPQEFMQRAVNLPELVLNRTFNMNDPQSQLRLQKLFVALKQKSIETLDPQKDTEVIKRVTQFYDIIEFEYFQFMNLDKMEKYTVISHGDCWNNNFMFRYTSEDTKKTNPVDIRFLDWQLSCVNSPVIDVAYFMYLCTDSELRDEHFDKLLDLYYTSLTDHIKMLGSNPEVVFPYIAFHRNVKRYFRFGVMMALNAINMLCSDADDIPDFDAMSVPDEKEEEALQNLVDTFNFQSKNDDLYKQRMSGVLRHAVKYDFI